MELFFTGRYTDRGRRTIAMAGGGGGGGVRGCVVSGRILFDYFSIFLFLASLCKSRHAPQQHWREREGDEGVGLLVAVFVAVPQKIYYEAKVTQTRTESARQ